MNKKLLPVIALAGAAVFSGPSLAFFDNGYELPNWTSAISNVGDGSSAFLIPTILQLQSSNNGILRGSNSNVDFTIAALGSGTVSFVWSYETKDLGGSQFDPFGYLLNDSFTQLTANGSFASQTGSASFLVGLGDTFGFRQGSTDSLFGRGYSAVTNFSAPVPEPGSLALVMAGLAVVGFVASRRLRGA